MARRAGVWVAGGAAAATGVLLAAPDAYAWLRSKAGLAPAHPEHELPADGHGAADSDAAFDTREARLSLRARLNEASDAETAVTPPAPAEDRPLAARPRPARAKADPMRRAVDDARTRMLDNARTATRKNGPAA
jgi:hypothetical protein